MKQQNIQILTNQTTPVEPSSTKALVVFIIMFFCFYFAVVVARKILNLFIRFISGE